MSAFDAARVLAIAQAVHVSPRQLLVLAARRVGTDTTDDAYRRSLLHAARAPGEAAETAAMLMRTPIAGFAQDDLAAALALPWPATPVAGE